jgi:hypothetical protein
VLDFSDFQQQCCGAPAIDSSGPAAYWVGEKREVEKGCVCFIGEGFVGAIAARGSGASGGHGRVLAEK